MRFETSRADLPFVTSATLVFFASLLVSLWDFLGPQSARPGAANAAGVVLFFLGFLLRQVGKKALGSNYSYGLRTSPDQSLVTTGVYARVRHPITLAAVIYSLAMPLVFTSLYGFIVMLLIVPLFLYRLKVEEKMLLARFGDEYMDYMRKTRRLVLYVY